MGTSLDPVEPHILQLLFALLKTKIQPSKFEDLIDFFERFTNGAASHLVDKRCSEELFNGRLFFFFFFNKGTPLFIYLFLAVLGLRFCARAFCSCGKRGPLFIAVRGPLIIAASLVAEHRLQTRRLSSCGSWAYLPSCSAACGIFHRPGLEPLSPALAGRFSTTAPPGNPPQWKAFTLRSWMRQESY